MTIDVSTRRRLLQRARPHLALGGDPLVLVDVGASLELFEPFTVLSDVSLRVGFDPDVREAPDVDEDGAGSRFVASAVATAEAIDDGTVRFYLTQNPTCSSTLPPNRSLVDRYSFGHRFRVVGEEPVAAQTLAESLSSIGCDRLDWIKLDTQGTDKRILDSLDEEAFGAISCIDVEPGLSPFYEGEDVFAALHSDLTSQGFWLADLHVVSACRIRSELVDQLPGGQRKAVRAAMDISLSARFGAPVALGARYLRTPESVAEPNDLPRLWACAVANGAVPFAYEVARAFADADGSERAHHLLALSRSAVRRAVISPRALLAKASPGRLRRLARSHY